MLRSTLKLLLRSVDALPNKLIISWVKLENSLSILARVKRDLFALISLLGKFGFTQINRLSLKAMIQIMQLQLHHSLEKKRWSLKITQYLTLRQTTRIKFQVYWRINQTRRISAIWVIFWRIKFTEDRIKWMAQNLFKRLRSSRTPIHRFQRRIDTPMHWLKRHLERFKSESNSSQYNKLEIQWAPSQRVDSTEYNRCKTLS